FQTTYGGQVLYYGDAFVTKLSADGSSLVYSTYLGGSDGEVAYGIALDGFGDAFVTGFTLSADFPTTPGAFDTVPGPGMCGSNNCRDVFVTKLNSEGSALAYSTFVGGSYDEVGKAIAVDGKGAAYVTGYTRSNDFPTTAGAFQTIHNGDFDVIAVKVNPYGTDLMYSTYIGGSGDCCLSSEIGYATAVDDTGRAFLSGYTYSDDFPTTPGAFDITWNGGSDDAFLLKLNPTGTGLVYSTFLGGSGYDEAY